MVHLTKVTEFTSDLEYSLFVCVHKLNTYIHFLVRCKKGVVSPNLTVRLLQ